MVPKPGRPKSKRTPVRLRHKIEKASAAKQRKQKKLAKKDPQWRSRLKKDPGIPNLFPYKEKILHEIEERKRSKEEEQISKREESRKTRENPVEQQSLPATNGADDDALSNLIDEEFVDQDNDPTPSDAMSALLASARARALEYDNAPVRDDGYENMDEDDLEDDDVDIASANALPTWGAGTLDNSIRAYSKVYKTVLQNSDIVLYVLDVRDPNGTRSREIEREIASADDSSKRMLLILNKIDLVPPHVLKGWLSHLRRFFPTLALNANKAAPNAKTFDHKSLTVKGTSETLLRALKTYAQSKQLKRSTTVGILGYPNVGKSSVINALTSRLGSARGSSTACPVGAEAGVTTALKEVKLDGKLKLLDSPGIIFPSSSSSSSSSSNPSTTAHPSHLTSKQAHQAHLVLLSAVPPSTIEDPIPAISLLLHRLSHSSATQGPLMEYYGIKPETLMAKNGDVTTDFLVQVARKRGRLGKGGVPNLHAAAMGVLADWRDGRVRGWVEPPPDKDLSPSDQAAEGQGLGSKEIVKEWAEEFKLDGLWGSEGDERVAQSDVMQQ